MRSQYEAQARESAERYALPVEGFLALIGVESAWNPNAVSPAGAQGLGQLMPPTAADMGVENPFDPEQNLNGSAKYLDWLRTWTAAQEPEIEQSPRLHWAAVLASYNWGPGNWRSAMRAGSDWPERLPSETEAYVGRLLPIFAGSQSEKPPLGILALGAFLLLALA